MLVNNELVKTTLIYTRYVLKGRRRYNILSPSSYYLYSNYLSKLSMYLQSRNFDNESLDNLIATTYDWSSNGNIYAENSIKKIFISLLFINTIT